MNSKLIRSITFCLTLIVANANADIINYPDTESPGLTFTNITESSLDTLPLFGAPSVENESLVFNNLSFATQTAGSLDFIDGRVTVTVTSKNSQMFSSFSLLEQGVYEIMGQGTVAVSGVAFAIADGEIYQADFQFDTSEAGTGKWSHKMNIDFAAPVSSFSLVMDNQLFGDSDANSFASIEKNTVELSVNSSSIPEPSAAMGSLLGLALLSTRRRR